jgi:hypothetical protein
LRTAACRRSGEGLTSGGRAPIKWRSAQCPPILRGTHRTDNDVDGIWTDFDRCHLPVVVHEASEPAEEEGNQMWQGVDDMATVLLRYLNEGHCSWRLGVILRRRRWIE